MGYDNENAERLVFDIETAPLPEAVGYLESVDAPSNYKDEVKIAAYIKEKQAEQLDRCGLDVDLCRIIAIGVQTERMPAPDAWLAKRDEEAEMLRAFWTTAQGRHLVGFNCLAFDLPVLLRRSLYLGVTPEPIQIDKFKHPRVTDIMQVLSFNGALRLRGLSFYAKRFGFEIEDGITGAGVAAALAEGRWDDIERHVVADVAKTAMLASRVGYFDCKPLVAA